MPDANRTPRDADRPDEPGGAYSKYVLAVLVLVYVLNFLDRNVLSILADDIKADLGISDSDLAFLYGTAFAVFYAIFGIPLGRLADVWTRRTVIALGLVTWSAMTVLSGFARSLTELTGARIGVGIGEASATPAAFSMLSDYFPPERRSTALAIYSSGIYIGGGLGLMIGGTVVARWNEAFAAGAAPLGLAGWQAAFLVVGLPGLLVSLWVRSLREPPRSGASSAAPGNEEQPWTVFASELRAVLPPFTLLNLWLESRSPAEIVRNLAIAFGLGLIAAGLAAATGDVAQWAALAVGIYCAASWAQSLRLRDPVTTRWLFGTPSLRWAALGFSWMSFVGYGLAFWIPPFFRRFHTADLEDLSLALGATGALGGWLGVTFGGILSDRLRRVTIHGRLIVGAIGAALTVPLTLWLISTPDLHTAYMLNLLTSVASAMWIGGGAASVQDLVPARTRAPASAFYILVLTFVGLALGPYTIGLISDATGDLRTGIRFALIGTGIGSILLLLAARTLARDEARAAAQ
jgi:MFS family permease